MWKILVRGWWRAKLALQEIDGGMEMVKEIHQSALYIWRLALSQNMHFGVATTSSILCMLAHDKICGKYVCGLGRPAGQRAARAGASLHISGRPASKGTQQPKTGGASWIRPTATAGLIRPCLVPNSHLLIS